ncbi:hypothetical protein [Salinibacter ruber]|uniref:hypothetical protein n=1 Tax=Salinibacter ruber TaxID=146919 RepID=UPI002166EB4F|nr:hypothetical protein [Salinibacter ruber]
MDLLKRLLILIAAHILGSLALVWINSNSKLLRQGEFKEWLLAAPLWTWILVGGVFLVTSSVRVTLWWKKSGQDSGLPIRSGRPVWKRQNEKRVTKVEHKGAMWDVMVDAGGLSRQTNLSNPSPEKIRVPSEPKCTNCGTGLTQEKRWWGKYEWSCPKCGRSTTSSDPMLSVATEAKKMAISNRPYN